MYMLLATLFIILHLKLLTHIYIYIYIYIYIEATSHMALIMISLATSTWGHGKDLTFRCNILCYLYHRLSGSYPRCTGLHYFIANHLSDDLLDCITITSTICTWIILV